MIDTLRSALKSLWTNKLRSFLSLLSIMIGIYAVVTLLSLARGVQKQVTVAVEGFGPTLIMIMPGEDTGEGAFNVGSAFAPSTLFLDDVELLQEKADLVAPNSIGYVSYTGGVLKKDDKKLSGFPFGGNPEVFPYLSLEKISGREMTQTDLDTKSKTIFITEKAAEKLTVGVGDRVTLGVTELTVEGIFRVKEEAKLDPTSADSIVIPATLAHELNQSEQVGQIMLKAKDIDSVNTAKEQISKLLTDKHGVADFTILLPTDLLKQFTEITDILTLMVVGIAAISLLVGGIGISNIMLVTVTERTREIGIRKAVGATEGAILLQFLIEAIVLTVIGALIGIGMAMLTGIIVAQYSPLDPVLSTGTILLAIGMAVLTGIIFGLFPAIRAARKNPVEALRFE
jgi:putative ABC transport system permease protein